MIKAIFKTPTGLFDCLAYVIRNGKENITVLTETGYYKFKREDVVSIEWRGDIPRY